MLNSENLAIRRRAKLRKSVPIRTVNRLRTGELVGLKWSEYVFLCRKGTPIKNSTYDTALYKICEKAGIKPFAMHILRDTLNI